jgi:hypothetical protein
VRIDGNTGHRSVHIECHCWVDVYTGISRSRVDEASRGNGENGRLGEKWTYKGMRANGGRRPLWLSRGMFFLPRLNTVIRCPLRSTHIQADTDNRPLSLPLTSTASPALSSPRARALRGNTQSSVIRFPRLGNPSPDNSHLLQETVNSLTES